MFKWSICAAVCLVALGRVSAQDPKTLDGEYLIESALKPGMVLEVKDAEALDYTPVQLAGPGKSDKRRLRIVLLGKGEYAIETVVKEGLVLDVAGAQAEKDTPLQLGGAGDPHRKENRRWKLKPVGESGEYQIESLLKENLLLELKDGKAEEGAGIQVGEAGPDAKQRWKLIRVDLGK